MRVERNEREVGIDAYVAPPARSRATTQWQYTFINGRYIRDRYVQHAVKEAYRGLMEPNRHGVVFLFLTMDPGQLDVNVHPTKIEVRWADSNLIHSQVLSALRETFQRSDLAPALNTDRAHEPASEAEQERMRGELAAVLKSATPVRPPASVPSAAPSGGSRDPNPVAQGRLSPAALDPAEAWRSLYGQSSAPEAAALPDRREAAHEEIIPRSRPRAVQMHNLYLVAETEDGIVIVDQHALHERVIYEQLRERLTEGSLESQRLLLPETMSVTPAQAALLTANGDLLGRLGIELTGFGTDAVAIHAFPSMLKDTDVASFMADLLDHLAQQPAKVSAEEVLHEILDMMACKAAIKAGDPLSVEEIDALMKRRHLIEKSSSCPHGRPTMLRLSKTDLDRQFKRT
jgi:DNA mismatch repair protein MutL